MDGKNRAQIHPGLAVTIILKKGPAQREFDRGGRQGPPHQGPLPFQGDQGQAAGRPSRQGSGPRSGKMKDEVSRLKGERH